MDGETSSKRLAIPSSQRRTSTAFVRSRKICHEFAFDSSRDADGCQHVDGHIQLGYYAAAGRTWLDRDPGLQGSRGPADRVLGPLVGKGALMCEHQEDLLLKRIMKGLHGRMEDPLPKKIMEGMGETVEEPLLSRNIEGLS